MKPRTGLFLSGALALALGCAVGCDSQATNQPVANAENLESVTFFVEGMIWGTAWTQAVEKQLNELPGVVQASTDMDAQTATVKFDPEKFQPEDAIDSITGRFSLSILESDAGE
jgi:copper chaperone CopZ